MMVQRLLFTDLYLKDWKTWSIFELMDGSPLTTESFNSRKFSLHLYKGKLNFFHCQCQVSTAPLSESITWAKKTLDIGQFMASLQ